MLGPYASFRLLLDNGFSVLDVKSYTFDNFNKDNITFCLTNNNNKSILNYDIFNAALENNFMAAELHFTFCRNDSEIVRNNKQAIEKSNELFDFFKNSGN
jgi:hypothetical protein